MKVKNQVFVGDCLDVLRNMRLEGVDLVYVDPPFFTQRVHAMTSRDGVSLFDFPDIWESGDSYANFLHRRLVHMRDAMKNTGSLFFHCDRSASHIVRMVLDDVFSPKNFQSKIFWSYKRWSNSRKGLLPAHQTLFFYSKSKNFKFNTLFTEYSPSTNIDQIMQKRTRDGRNKSVYAKRDYGSVIGGGAKKGVPLSDVWEIPFLNPKAKERVGYPTQKPVLLMNRIIELVTDPGDTVLDPFCGSGTTLVAAGALGRHSIGIDVSKDAITLTKDRLANPTITKSALFENGADSYLQHASEAELHLSGIDYIPVHRNKGIDGLLKREISGLPVFVRVQRDCETLRETISALTKAAKNKGKCRLVVIATRPESVEFPHSSDVVVIPSTSLSLTERMKDFDPLKF